MDGVSSMFHHHQAQKLRTSNLRMKLNSVDQSRLPASREVSGCCIDADKLFSVSMRTRSATELFSNSRSVFHFSAAFQTVIADATASFSRILIVPFRTCPRNSPGFLLRWMKAANDRKMRREANR